MQLKQNKNPSSKSEISEIDITMNKDELDAERRLEVPKIWYNNLGTH